MCLAFVIGICGSRQQYRPSETQAKTLDDFSQTIRHLHSVSPLTSSLIMWAVLVVAYASDYASFRGTARSLMEWMLKTYPEANSWNYLRNVLQGFFWCNKAGLENRWHAYWERIKTTAEHSELQTRTRQAHFIDFLETSLIVCGSNLSNYFSTFHPIMAGSSFCFKASPSWVLGYGDRTMHTSTV